MEGRALVTRDVPNQKPVRLAELEAEYGWAGVDTCAATGMCATRCPVGINTGALMKQLKGWILEDGKLVKVYAFRNYYETMAFVNALAWISHREDHHPDITVGWNTCRVTYVTHAIKGLSENDFICAAKLDALFDL